MSSPVKRKTAAAKVSGGGSSNAINNSKMTSLEIEEGIGIKEKNTHSHKCRRVVWVKKNLIDQTAALSYSMGVSIVHIAMFVSL